MSYKDRLRPASFRGIPFLVKSHDVDAGKRVTQHEFGGRDEPYAESMGRKGKSYKITGFLIGDDVFSKRDSLIRAFDRDGPGTLLHPFLGILNVECGPAQFSEDMTEGRMARFTVEFFEKGSSVNPGSFLDKVGKFFTSANAKLDALRDQFAIVSTLASTPGYVLDSAISLVQLAHNSFLDVLGELANPSAYVASIKKDVLDFGDEFVGLLSAPVDFADAIIGVIKNIGSSSNSHKNKQEIYNKILGFDSDQPEYPRTTATRTVQQSNLENITNLIKVSTYVMALRDFTAAVNDTFPDDETRLKDAVNDIFYSFSEIETRRNELLSGYAALITQEINYEIYDDLVEVSSLAAEALPSPDDVDSKIKRISSYTPRETMASLLLAYDLYEDASNEEDLINRNRIQHPGFIPGGEELEVLSE